MLKSLTKRMKDSEEGFTLIELLIVIVILGILAAIVVFSVNGISDRGSESACQANLHTVDIASEAYRASNTSYAADLEALRTAGFIKTIPGTLETGNMAFTVRPGGGTPYRITYSASAAGAVATIGDPAFTTPGCPGTN